MPRCHGISESLQDKGNKLQESLIPKCFFFFFLKYTHIEWQIKITTDYQREENKDYPEHHNPNISPASLFSLLQGWNHAVLVKKKKKRCKSCCFIPLRPHCHSLRFSKYSRHICTSWPLHLLFFLHGMFFLWNSNDSLPHFFQFTAQMSSPPRRLLDHTGWNNCFTLAFFSSCVLLYSPSMYCKTWGPITE